MNLFNDIKKHLVNYLEFLIDYLLIKFFLKKEINTDLIAKINNFKAHLTKVSEMIHNFIEMTKNVSKEKTNCNERCLRYFKYYFMKQYCKDTIFNYCLPDYEKNCLAEYLGF